MPLGINEAQLSPPPSWAAPPPPGAAMTKGLLLPGSSHLSLGGVGVQEGCPGEHGGANWPQAVPGQGGHTGPMPSHHRDAGCHVPGNTGSPWCWPSSVDSDGSSAPGTAAGFAGSAAGPPGAWLKTRRAPWPQSWAASRLLIMISFGGQAAPVDFSGTAFMEKCWSRHPRNPELRRSRCRWGAGFRSQDGLWPWPGLGPGAAAGPCWVPCPRREVGGRPSAQGCWDLRASPRDEQAGHPDRARVSVFTTLTRGQVWTPRHREVMAPTQRHTAAVSEASPMSCPR